MNELFIIMFGFAAGIVLGIFFFSGLWLTLKRLPSSRHPVLLTLGSFFGRTAVCIFCFCIVVKVGNWEGLIASLGGFTLIRFALVRRLQPVGTEFFRTVGQNGRNKP